MALAGCTDRVSQVAVHRTQTEFSMLWLEERVLGRKRIQVL